MLAEAAAAGRRPTARAVGAGGIAVVGLALLVGTPGQAGAAGIALALLAAAGFAAMTLLAARPVAGLDDGTTTAVSFTIGGAVLLAAAAPITVLGCTRPRT